MGNLWQREGRCQVRKAFSGARNVSKINWFPSNRAVADPPLFRRGVHVVVGLKSFSPLLFKIKKSFGTSPNDRPYENMFLNNFLISIFRFRLSIDQDGSSPEIGKMI